MSLNYPKIFGFLRNRHHFLRTHKVSHGERAIGVVVIEVLPIVNTHTVELQWLEHRWLVYHGLFELIYESVRNFSDSTRKQIMR